MDHASENILAATSGMLDRIFAAKDAAGLSQLLQRGLDRNQYLLDREIEGLGSVRKLAPGAVIAPAIERLRRIAGEQPGRLRDAANARAASLGIAGPVQPAGVTPDPTAARMIVKRKRMGTLPFDDLPAEQWEGYPYSSWALVPVTALYWCDGHRTLAEVMRLTGMEYDTTGFDFVGYFRFLARHQYVDILEK